MTIDKQQLRAAASEASMLVEDIDGEWVDHVIDLRIESERLPSELAGHIELASPSTVLALLDEIERLTKERDDARELLEAEPATGPLPVLRRERDAALARAESTALDLAAANQQVTDLSDQLQSAIERGSEDMQRAAERLVFALYIYSGHRLNSRGPYGCIIRALELLAPSIAAPIKEGTEPSDVYSSHWSEDGAPLEEQPAVAGDRTTPVDDIIDNLVGEFHHVVGTGRSFDPDRDWGKLHALAVALQDTRRRLIKLEAR